MESNLEPQSSLNPVEALNILKRWAESELPLAITTTFPALEIGGTVFVSRIEEDAIELSTGTRTAFTVIPFEAWEMPFPNFPRVKNR